MIIWLIISLLTVAADQLLKYLVIQNISLTDTFEVIPNVFNLVFVKNTGAAFSIMSGKTFILNVVSTAVCIAIIWYCIKKKPSSNLIKISLGLILGGAAGNLVDRVFRAFVIDYIEIAFMNFPIFNLADIAITAGAVLLMIYVVFFDGKGNKE